MINGFPVSAPEGTTILDAAASAGIEIPSLCYLKGLNEISACRVCCVEIEGEGKLVPSCNNVVREGMVIHTNSPRVREARRTNVELILSQHDNKCATCVRSGTCQLQKVANDLGVLSIPYPPDLARGKKAFWTTTFPLYRDTNKCIKCMRCVQVCDKIQSLSVWDVSGSGSRTTIDVSGNRFIKESDCSLCGQCITHCPTGALRERRHGQGIRGTGSAGQGHCRPDRARRAHRMGRSLRHGVRHGIGRPAGHRPAPDGGGLCV